MAIANLDTNKKVCKYNTVNPTVLTAFDGTDGAEYTVTAQDERLILIIENTHTAANDVTIVAPTNKAYAGAVADVKVQVPAGNVAAIPVESVKFMDTVTKKITVKGAATVKGAVFKI